MSGFFRDTALIFHISEIFFLFFMLLIFLVTTFWSVYLNNEVMLAQKKLKYSLKYINDGRLGAIIRKCNVDKWKSALLLLIGISESFNILFVVLSCGSAFNLLNLTKSCQMEFSIQIYQELIFPGISMLLMTVIFSLLNIITLFFIGIYSYHSVEYNHRKQLLFLCIRTCILLPMILIPYTVAYGMFVSICVMILFSYTWIKNTRRLLLILKWRFDDMKEECYMKAMQIKYMRRRYRRLTFLMIVVLQPVIVDLFCEFLLKCLIISKNNCTQYYTLQYLDSLSPQVFTISFPILQYIMILSISPTFIMSFFYLVYTAWFFAGTVWRCVSCRRRRNSNELYRSLLS